MCNRRSQLHISITGRKGLNNACAIDEVKFFHGSVCKLAEKINCIFGIVFES